MNPLADRIRPKTLDEIIGQTHILAPDKLLYKAIKSGQLFSMIFWGPPGVGKTTLARIIANEVNADFIEFSAVNTSIVQLKKIFEDLSKGQRLQKTIVFIDEIHRFSKSQQDAFLPFVENGTITLIGATTENPSFEVISALLSRCRVFTLKQLTSEELNQVIERALKDKVSGLGEYKIKFAKGAKELLLEGSNGDSRSLLNALEIAVTISSFDQYSVRGPAASVSRRRSSASTSSHHAVRRQDLSSTSPLSASMSNTVIITKELVEEALQKKALAYDKGGEEHYNTISAFIKSMRASQVDSALYYLARMVDSGEDPLFIARRMVIFASEDIGVAQPTALVVANEVFKACEVIGYPECQINLAHGVVYLCLAKKDRSSYEAYFAALEDVQKYGNLPIPLNLRNAPTKLMKSLGYGQNYQKYDTASYLPEKLKHKKYFSKKD